MTREPTEEDLLTKVGGRAKVVDTLLENIEKTVGRLTGLGMEKEDALRTAVRLHEAEFAFFDDYGGGGAH